MYLSTMRVSLLAAWQEVEQRLGDGDNGDSTDSQGPIQYTEKTPSAAMKSKCLHLHCLPVRVPFGLWNINLTVFLLSLVT